MKHEVRREYESWDGKKPEVRTDQTGDNQHLNKKAQ